MASVALSRSRSKRDPDPKQQLRDALTRFESILTDDQRLKFQASNTTPDADSVLKFVDEIDNTNNTMKQCVGPRLSTFLGRLEQFTSIVDTFVSSHPEIAALVWGGVKTALLAINNITSYYDKVTGLIMEVGKSCPTYQQFGHLYRGCVRVQSALCGYYAVIVSLCIKVIEVSRRPQWQQTFSSIIKPFDADFKDILEDLAKAARDIEQQLSVASKQDIRETKNLLEADRRKYAIFQKESRSEYADARQWRLEKSKRDADNLRMRIRNNLSTIDYVKPCNRARRQRVKGTAEWLLEDSIFLKWQDDSATAILWCPGKMGAGKTVLMSHVVARLHKPVASNEIMAYYFCRADDSITLSARNIMGTLARQILDYHITHAEEETLQCMFDDSKDLDTSELTYFILPRLQADKKYYLIIDGLDECEPSEVREVAQSVAQLCSMRAKDFKVLYSARSELETALFGVFTPKYRIPVTEEKIGSEMDRYIAATLERCLDEEQLVLGDKTLRLKIEEALQKGSQGMFLWTRLFIEELCAQGSDNEILEALKHPPRALSDIFNRKLSRVRGKTARDDAFRLLQYCGVTRRPLTTMEYQEALSLTPGQQSLDRGNFPNDMNKVIRHCCGLTCVDEEDRTVHYVHHSVKQHLFTTDCQHSEEFNAEKLGSHIGVICMTYLDFTDLKRQLKLFEPASKVSIRPVQLGVLPFSSPGGVAGQIAHRLLLHPPQLQHITPGELRRKTKQAVGDEESISQEAEPQSGEFHFLEYARNYWINHLANLSTEPHDPTWSLFCRCLEGDDIIAYKPWDSDEESQNGQNDIPLAIQWLSAHGHYPLLVYYHRHRSSSLTKEVNCHILRTSVVRGHQRLVDYILSHIPNSFELIELALFVGSLDEARKIKDAVLLFINNPDVQVIEPENFKKSAHFSLELAVKGNQVDVVRRVMETVIHLNVPISDVVGKTALDMAAIKGYVEIFRLLFDVNADFIKSALPLAEAALGGSLYIVEQLLAANAPVEGSPHDEYGSPLCAAARRGHFEIVERLLAANAPVEGSPHDEYGSPLCVAARRGHFEIVERLLAANADVNKESSAIAAAAEGGHLEVVERLLAANADVNKEPSAIAAAAEGGHLEIVKRLFAAKADLGLASKTSRWSNSSYTALEAAERNNHSEVVTFLKEAGAKR